MPVYLSRAILTLPAQDDVADDGDVEIKWDFLIAIPAMRRRIDDGFLQRKPIDQDIDETSQSGSEDRQDDDDYGFHNCCALLTKLDSTSAE